MPLFRYKAITADGRQAQGEVEAPTRAAAVARLQNDGCLPLSAAEVRQGERRLPSLPAYLRRGRSVGDKETALFIRELATLLQAGLPLDQALTMLQEAAAPAPVKDLVRDLRQKVREGHSLAAAMAGQEQVFNRLCVNLVRAGEAGGALHAVLDRLADYLERMAALRSMVITAAVYPALLAVVSLLSLIVLLTFVVPQFTGLFEDAEQSLPLVSRVVFGAAAVFQQYWWTVPGGVAIGAWVAHRQLARPEARLRFDRRRLELPLLGKALKSMETARFARTLGMLIDNGVPLPTAVGLVREVISNLALRRVMDAVSADLEEGRRMAPALKESGIFPLPAVQLIEVGEESGRLKEMLDKAADIHDKEVQADIKRLLVVLEPVLILGLGGLIAVIMAAVLAAVLGLNKLVV